jgi:DNA-binding beta-propeller fold protein YncE
VATPDGKYVYVNGYYQLGQNYGYLIIVFDVVHGTATSLDTQTLGVWSQLVEMTVSPDGQSLLLNALSANGSPIAVFDISVNPKNPTLVTTITGTPPPGSPAFAFYSWKVAAGRLFALDYAQNAIVAFNFDRAHGNFSQLNYYLAPLQYYPGYLAVSPDGNLIYLPIENYDFISVLDANALVNGQDPLLTNIGAFVNPYQVIVNPAALLDKNREPSVHERPLRGELQQPAREVDGHNAAEMQ